mgnify:CR=1 FL=1
MKSSVISVREASVVKDLNKLSRILWGAALLTIPVTSFRWFPFLDEGTLVRPLALYPLALLLPLLLIQAWRGKINLYFAGAFVALGAFVLFVFTATSFGILIDPIPLRGQEYLGRALRALATLLIGLAFFISAVWMNKNEDDLRFSVKWIFAGLGLTIAWSSLQVVTFYTGLLDKEMVTHWQLAFSTHALCASQEVPSSRGCSTQAPSAGSNLEAWHDTGIGHSARNFR